MFRIKNRKLLIFSTAVFIILLSFLLRVQSPQSDLPPDISISGSIYTDEGNQCHNSRSKVLYDNWFPDNWKITNYNPVVPYFKFLIFKVFGVGLVQVRSVSFFFALLSLIFFFLILRSYFSSWLSVAGISLLGFNFLYIMYNRIGTFETPMIFWMILSLYFLERYRACGKLIFPALSGLAAFMSFVFKMTGAHIIPVPLLALLLFLLFIPVEKTPEKKKIAESIAVLIFAIVISFAVWMVIFYIPNREWIKSAPGSYIGNQMFPKSLEQLTGNILAYNWKEQFYKMWVVWMAAILYIPVFFRRLINRLSDITEIGFVLFLLSHTGALMIMNHRPTRYLIAAIPPMVFMTILFFRYLMNNSKKLPVPGPVKSVFIIIFDIFWLFLSLYYCILPLLTRAGIKIFPVKFTLDLFLISMILTALYHFLSIAARKYLRSGFKTKNISIVFVILLISVSIYTNLSYYYLWNRDRTEYVHNISEELDKKIVNGYIAGLTAPVAVLGTDHKSLFLYPEFVHWEKDTLDKYGITHALLANFNFEISNFFGQWPGKMDMALLLNVYNVKDQFLHLYSFREPVITGVRRIDGESLEISLINNGSSREIHLGRIEFDNNNKKGNYSDQYKNTVQQNPILVRSGLNTLRIPDEYNSREKLIYIKNCNWGNKYRYEAEKFPRKRGRVIRDTSSSGKHVRYFNIESDRKGFIACSIGGKFIPYSEGFMAARFYLKFDKIKSRIRPLAVVDIFNNSSRSVAAGLSIKKKDLNGAGFYGYQVVYKNMKTNDIEFRVHAERTADIYFDYLELEYYQGKFIDRN